jgi:hypothetical protein
LLSEEKQVLGIPEGAVPGVKPGVDLAEIAGLKDQKAMVPQLGVHEGEFRQWVVKMAQHVAMVDEVEFFPPEGVSRQGPLLAGNVPHPMEKIGQLAVKFNTAHLKPQFPEDVEEKTGPGTDLQDSAAAEPGTEKGPGVPGLEAFGGGAPHPEGTFA